MRLRPEQLAAHLQQPLLPVYLVTGEEPLQLTEAVDAIRSAARAQGFAEREVMQVEPGFDWGALAAAADNLSLFAERRLLELRIPSAKPGDAGGKALTAYAQAPAEENCLLISCGKLDKRQQQSKWFKALEGAGAVLQLWPVEYKALPGWIAQRMRSRGLEPSPEAARLLAERVEGNLLAAAQEVEKLVMLYGTGPVDLETVREAVSDSSRYDVFELVDAALLGDAPRVSHILDGLRGEGVEPILVLWALSRELRSMETMASALAGGEGLDRVLSANRVWEKRKPPVRAALQRHGNPRRWQAMLYRGARIDRMVKGVEPGNAWDELLQLALLMAGTRLV